MKINFLHKSYGNKCVLDIKEISFNNKGIIGILGINGAGKTTFFKSITDLVYCDLSERYKSDISFFPDNIDYFNVKISEFGKILSDTYKDFSIAKYYEMSEYLGLKINGRIKSLSRGEKVLLNLVITLSRDVKYYLIDELYSNVDFETREKITEVIVRYADVKNKTIFISSHEVDDIERILDYVVILHNRNFSKIETIEDIKDGHKSLYNWFESYILKGVNYE